MLESLSVKYSTRDLIFDVNYCAWGAKMRRAPYNVNAISVPFTILTS